jgi:hypothetical protein
MKNVRAVIIASALAMLTACAVSPTSPRLGAPGGPARGGGLSYGSGNAVPTDTSASTTAADPSGTAAEPGESTEERGGMGYGSGN